jgi:hypothetical protein
VYINGDTHNNLQRHTMAAVFNITAVLNVQAGNLSALKQTLNKQIGDAVRGSFSPTSLPNLATALGLGLSAREALLFQRAMVAVRQVSEATSSEIRGLSSSITSLSTAFGASSLDLARAAVQLKQAGLSLRETEAALTSLAKASQSPEFPKMESAVQGVIAATRQFGLSAEKGAESLGSIIGVSSQYAVESRDLIEAVSKAGGSFKAAGGNLEEFLGLFTSVRNTTREGASEIATGLRTIFSRLQKEETVDRLRELGINVRYTREEAERLNNVGLTDKFVGGFESVRRISSALSGVSPADPRFAQIAQEVGGTHQISRTIPLLQQFKTAEEARLVALGSSAALTVSAEKASEAYLVQLQQLNQQLQQFSRSIVDSEGFKRFAELFFTSANAAVQLANALRPLVPLLAGLAAVKLGQTALSGLGSLGLSSTSLQKSRLGIGIGLAGAGAAFAGDQLYSSAGEAGPAIQGGQENAFRFRRAGGSSLQLAGFGAIVGSPFGPLGAALGAAVFATYGFTSALKDATEELKEAQLGRIRSDLSESLQKNSRPEIDRNLSRFRSASFNANLDEATGIFGFDPKQFAELQKKDLRESYSLIPLLARNLNREAEKVGRSNPTASIPDLAQRVQQENRQLVDFLASTRNVGPREIRRELEERILSGQRANQARADDSRSERTISAFGRLTTAAASAANGLEKLQTRSDLIAETFGVISPIRVSAQPEALGQFGGPDSLLPLSIARNIGGQTGRELYERGRAANSIARILPSVLGTSISQPALDSDTLATRVRTQARTALGFSNREQLPAALEEVLSSVINQLRKADLGTALEKTKNNVSSFADELLSVTTGPVREFGAGLARIVEERASSYIVGLTEVQRQKGIIAESAFGRDSLSVAFLRQQSAIIAERQGRPSQALSLLPLSTLQFPFQQRQERSTGFQGRAAVDPALIGQNLSAVQRQIQVAAERQQQALFNPGNRGENFARAADALAVLRDRAVNLQNALKHLADASERNAALQEKLSLIRSDEEGRIGLAERFARGDAPENARLQQGLFLGLLAYRQKADIGILPTDTRNAILDALSAGGNARVTAIPGKPSLADVRNELLKNFAGGVFQLDREGKAEKDQLQGVIARNLLDAARAQQELTRNYENANRDFLSSLRQIHEQFFAKLGQSLTENARIDIQNKLAAAQGREGELKKLTEDKAFLATAGITTDEQLERLQNARPDLEALFAGKKRSADFRESLSDLTSPAVIRQLRDTTIGSQPTFDVASQARLIDRLLTEGFQPENANRVFQGTKTLLSSSGLKPTPALVESALRQSIFHVGLRQSKQEEEKELGPVRERLHQQGVNTRAIEGAIVFQDDAKRFTDALDSFGKSRIGLGDLATELAKVTVEIEKLKTALKNISSAGPAPFPPVPVQNRAAGGSIFKPKGTDTVPAMLTPGEYVVNAASTRANLPLLERINKQKGPAYLAEGGYFNPYRPRDFSFGVPALKPEAKTDLASSAASIVGTAAAGLAGVLPTVPYVAPATPQPFNPYQALEDDAKRRRANRLLQAEVEFQSLSNPFGQTALTANQILLERQIKIKQQKENLRAAAQNRKDQQRLAFGKLLDDPSLIGKGGERVFLPEAEARIRERDARERAQALRRSTNHFRRQRQIEKFGGQEVYDKAQREKSIGDFSYLFAQQAAVYNAGRAARQSDLGQAFNVDQTRSGFQKTHEGFRQDRRYQRGVFSFVKPQRFAAGGPVSGHGTTDNVISLLTPGEFVLNRAAVARAGLENLQRFNRGGPVGYYQNGGAVAGQGAGAFTLGVPPEFQNGIANFASSVSALSSSFSTFNQAATSFAGTINAFSTALNSIPKSLAFQGNVSHTVTFNGAEILAKLTPALEEMVVNLINDKLRTVFKTHLPDAGIQI